MVKHLQKDPAFAAEYLTVALEDEEAGIPRIALRHLAKVSASANSSS